MYNIYIYIYIYIGECRFRNPSQDHVRDILSFQQPAFQKFAKHRRISHSRFKCFSLFRANSGNVGC